MAVSEPDEQLDKSIPVPVYYQLEQLLRRRIASGVLGPGDQLPTELELQKIYGVSRATVRQALARLEREGLLERKRSIGTVVSTPRLEEPFTGLGSFSLALIQQGRSVETRILSYSVGAAEDENRRILQLSQGEEVITIRRLILVDGKPTDLATARLSHSAAPSFSQGDLTATGLTQSLYYVLEHKHGVLLSAADISISPLALDESAARLLEKPRGSPAILRTRMVYGDTGAPILYEASVFCHTFTMHTRRGEHVLASQVR